MENLTEMECYWDADPVSGITETCRQFSAKYEVS